MRTPVLILPVKGKILRTWGEGGVKKGKILLPSFMEGPYSFIVIDDKLINIIALGKRDRDLTPSPYARWPEGSRALY